MAHDVIEVAVFYFIVWLERSVISSTTVIYQEIEDVGPSQVKLGSFTVS